MTTNAATLYALGLDQATNLILAVGKSRTVLVQGHMGTGKSSMLDTLAAQLPTHTPFYFDTTTKDVGDIAIPDINADTENGAAKYLDYLLSKELGLHLDTPVIVMLDEIGKGNNAVKRALTRFMLERTVYGRKLHPDSIVFATTNLGAEGVGDMLEAHQANRVIVINTRKPTNVEWIEWGVNNNIHPTVLGWAKDNPQLFQSFEEIKDPEENPYIFHPRAAGRSSFVTPRSLHAASDLINARHSAALDDQTVTAGLMGTIGARGALDLMAFVALADQLPSRDSIVRDPMGAKIPTSASAVCMVVYRALSTIDAEWIDAWMTYLGRLHREAQALFVNGVRSEKYSKRSLVMQNKTFTAWCMKNNWMFVESN